MKIKERSSIDRVRTTIGVRLATKYLVLDHSFPGESFDDAIVRIIKENERMQAQLSRYSKLEDENLIKMPKIILEEQEIVRDTGLITTEDGFKIVFGYNLPPNDLVQMNSYTMDIVIEKVLKDGKQVFEATFNKKELIQLHLTIIQDIIRMQFDRGFEFDRRTSMIDPRYWRNVCKRVGLPESAYLKDILGPITEFESGMNESNTGKS